MRGSARPGDHNGMSDSPAIKGIRRAAKQRARADEMKHKATNQLRDYCRAAQTEGVSMSRIAQEAGLSRQAFTTYWRTRDLPDEPINAPRVGTGMRRLAGVVCRRSIELSLPKAGWA